MSGKRITVNGRVHRVGKLDDLSYARLCALAGVSSLHNPSVTWSTPDGRAGTISHGQRAPLADGGVYNVMVCGAA